ncbi:MAG: hypothetical protein R2752_02860 [Vicinamibacterales bacterium]
MLPTFSLFDGDLVNRTFGWLGMRSRRTTGVVGRCVTLVVLTWVPMALLAWKGGLFSAHIEARNFFADYAAYGQFLVAMPLFVIAERIVLVNTREAALDFLRTGVVEPANYADVGRIHLQVRQRSTGVLPEVACIVIAYWLAYMTFRPEFVGTSTAVTWHTTEGADGVHRLTGAGWWALLVALPLLNYWWLRLAWKIAVWTAYLRRMSRLPLHLVASHPDQTGGIGFVSEVQAKFALVLFAYGVSNVAAVIAYKVGIEGASLAEPPVWGPAIGFVVIAPALFTLPLLMFTRQLNRAKRRAIAAYREHAHRHARLFEARWLRGEAPEGPLDVPEVSGLNNVAAMFTRITQMRVVPFDLRSFTQLMASTLGSVATALPIVRLDASLKDWLDLGARLLGR